MDALAPPVAQALENISTGRSFISTAYDNVWASREGTSTTDESVLSFLRMGACGARTPNMERDIFRSWLVKCGLQVDIEELLVEVQPVDSTKINVLRCAIIPPSQMFHAVEQMGTQVFHRAFVGETGRSGLHEWWSAAMEEECFQEHPMLQGTVDLTKLIPITLFIDGAEVFNNVEYVYCLWRSVVVSKQDPSDYVFPMCVIPAILLRDPHYRKAFYRTLAARWGFEFEHLGANAGPWRGFYSEEFDPKSLAFKLRGECLSTAGFKLVFAGVCHDAKARKEVHNFKNGPQSMFICDGCSAVQSFPRHPKHLNYTDFGEEPGWLGTQLTHELYLALCDIEDLSPFACVLGWSIDLNWWDPMHNESLGFLRDIVPTVAYHWIGDGVYGVKGTFDQKALRMQCEMSKYCRAHKIQPPTGRVFSHTTFGRDPNQPNSKFPELSSTYKAASVKSIMYYLSHKAATMVPEFLVTEQQKLVCACVFWYGRYLRTLDRAGNVLTNEERWTAYRAGMKHLQCYRRLASWGVANKIRLWKHRPKQHYFHHQLLRLKKSRLNPKCFQNSAEETMLGRLKKIGAHTHKSQTSLRILQRHLLHLGMRWRKQRRQGSWQVRT